MKIRLLRGTTPKLIGMDQETDLAVIKIDIDRPLPAAKLGNSDGMQVGDWVLAIGSPFGLAGNRDCRHRLGQGTQHRSQPPVPILHSDGCRD